GGGREGGEVEEGREEPLAQGARAHGRGGAIEHGQERAARAPVLRPLEELEGGHGGGIEHERITGGEPLKPREMAEWLALSLQKIRERRSRRLDARTHVPHSKPVE